MRLASVLIATSLVAGAAQGQDVGVFASSSLHQGNLGGLAGADAICDGLGTAAIPGSGPWKAWLSVAGFGTPSTNAGDRVAQPAGGAYVRAAQPDTVVANDLADLTDGTLDNAILLDESGAEATGLVWTGTLQGGTPNGDDCSGWVSGDFLAFGHYGRSDLDTSEWTSLGSDECVAGARLYCFGPLAAAGDPDSDADGVSDSLDVCPGTAIPEGVPTRVLRVNHFALVDDDDVFDTKAPNGRGPEKSFTLAETAGCSCEQIVVALGLGKGHVRFGCSISAMEAWAALVGS